MKSKNLVKSIQNTKFDFVKNFKYFIIAPLVLLLVGCILLFTVGFNKGIDFTGGTIVNVYVGEELKDEDVYNQTKQKIENVLSNNGLVASMYQTAENNLGLCLSVRYQDIEGKTEQQMEQINSNVATQLFEAFEYDSADIIEKQYIQGSQRIDASVGNDHIINVFSTIVIASLVILVYLFIRFGVTSGMSALLIVYHDLLVMLALVLICRFEVNTAFVAGIIAVMAYSFINTVLLFDNVRTDLKDDAVVKNKVIANNAIKTNLPQSIMTNGAVLVSLLLFGIIAVKEVASFAFPVIFGILASFYSSNFLAPSLWSFAYVRKNKIKQKANEDFA